VGYLSDLAAQYGTTWYWVPGHEKYSKKISSVPNARMYGTEVWPIPSRGKWFRRFIAGKGPNGSGAFGYKRQANRTHAGTDCAGRYRDVIVAVADGEIASFYHFYSGTYALFVNHGNYVVNYGEVDGNSLTHFNLNTPYIKMRGQKGGLKKTGLSGSSVKKGQPIAMVGRMESGSSMLHFEVYSSGHTNQPWRGGADASPPSRLMNPENFLLAISGQRVPRKETPIATAVCR